MRIIVKISKVKLTYYDGQDSESLIRGFDNGDYTVARVFPNGSNYKSVEKKHKDDIVFSDQGSSTYNLSFNIDRQAYENYDENDRCSKELNQESNLE